MFYSVCRVVEKLSFVTLFECYDSWISPPSSSQSILQSERSLLKLYSISKHWKQSKGSNTKTSYTVEDLSSGFYPVHVTLREALSTYQLLCVLSYRTLSYFQLWLRHKMVVCEISVHNSVWRKLLNVCYRGRSEGEKLTAQVEMKRAVNIIIQIICPDTHHVDTRWKWAPQSNLHSNSIYDICSMSAPHE